MLLASNVSQHLSSPGREVLVRELDIQGVVHIGDGEDHRGRIHGVGWGGSGGCCGTRLRHSEGAKRKKKDVSL
jgi:hypothetical protein